MRPLLKRYPTRLETGSGMLFPSTWPDDIATTSTNHSAAAWHRSPMFFPEFLTPASNSDAAPPPSRPLLDRARRLELKGRERAHFSFSRCPVVFYRRYWLSIFNVSITVAAAVGYDRITRALEESATELVKLQGSEERRGRVRGDARSMIHEGQSTWKI